MLIHPKRLIQFVKVFLSLHLIHKVIFEKDFRLILSVTDLNAQFLICASSRSKRHIVCHTFDLQLHFYSQLLLVTVVLRKLVLQAFSQGDPFATCNGDVTQIDPFLVSFFRYLKKSLMTLQHLLSIFSRCFEGALQ